MMESELIRLRTLVVEMQGKIDVELCGFSFQKQCNGSGFVFKEGDFYAIDLSFCNDRKKSKTWNFDEYVKDKKKKKIYSEITFSNTENVNK